MLCRGPLRRIQSNGQAHRAVFCRATGGMATSKCFDLASDGMGIRPRMANSRSIFCKYATGADCIGQCRRIPASASPRMDEMYREFGSTHGCDGGGGNSLSQATESARCSEGAELGRFRRSIGAVWLVLAGRIAGYLGKVDQGLGLGEGAWLEMGARTSPAGVIDKAIVRWRILDRRVSFVH